MKLYEYSIISGGIQHANLLPFIGAALGGLASGVGALAGGAASVAGGTIGALGSAAGFLGETAIGAGGTVLGGIGSLGTGIIDTSAGLVSGAGTALFGGGTATPGLTVGEQMGLIAEPGFYETAAGGGLFSNLSLDTLGKVATAGYSIYQSAEDRKLAEKAIEAQSKAGYVIGTSGAPISGAPMTGFAPTTVVVPSAAAAAAKELDTKVMIKYAIIVLVAYFLFKGFK